MAVPPPIDDRSYEDLRAELIDRIAVHTPEWTNHGPGDPGVTLLELFAFLGDSLIYRANRLPERARQQFLELLRIPGRPATAAEGLVSFDKPKGPRRRVHVAPGLRLTADRLPFQTLTGLDVLPVVAAPYVKAPLDPERADEVRRTYGQAFGPVIGDAEAAFYETTPVTFATDHGAAPLDVGASSVDGALWLALLAPKPDPQVVAEARDALGGAVLTLGVMPPLDATPRVLPPGGGPSLDEDAGLRFDLPTVPATPTVGAARTPVFTPLDARVLLDPLRDDGPAPASTTDPRLIEVPLPPADQLALPEMEPLEAGVGSLPPLLEGDDAGRLITWLRVRASEDDGRSELRLAWIGANAAFVRQHERVDGDQLGSGDGTPDQQLSLARTPVLPGTVHLTVGGVTWQEVSADELAVAPGERDDPAAARVFAVDRTTGLVRFGSGLSGARPPRGQQVVAAYVVGGGRAGLVPPGAITNGPNLPSGLTVTNPVATWGAGDAETVEERERRIPAHLRHRDRAVTSEDVVDVALATPGVHLGRVEARSLFHPEHPDVEVPGAVTVLVVPQFDPVTPDAPVPDRFALERVCRHLAPRRLVTTEVHVRGPRYVDVWLTVGFEPVPGRDGSTVREAIAAALRDWLSPLRGGVEGTGWPLDTPVSRLAAVAVASLVDGVAYVTDVLLTDASGAARDQVRLSGLELPRHRGVQVRRGDPPPLADAIGGTPPPDGPRPLPVPAVPEDC